MKPERDKCRNDKEKEWKSGRLKPLMGLKKGNESKERIMTGNNNNRKYIGTKTVGRKRALRGEKVETAQEKGGGTE